MQVNAAKNSLKIIDELNRLGKLTLKVIELLPRQYSVTVKDRVLLLWMEALRQVYEANTIELGEVFNNRRRLEKQRFVVTSLMSAESFLSLIVNNDQLSEKSFAQWQQQAIIVRKMMAGWIRKDKERNSLKAA